MKIHPHFYYVLPLWGCEELLFAAKETEEVWSPLYENFGGVVRNVLCIPWYATLQENDF